MCIHIYIVRQQSEVLVERSLPITLGEAEYILSFLNFVLF